MGMHDEYGKRLLRLADRGIEVDGPTCNVALGRGSARIDGVLGGQVAIEVESRTSKQVRGAVRDLLVHGAPKKLLILIPKYMSNPESCREDCAAIIGRFVAPQNYRVIHLRGTLDVPAPENDLPLIQRALTELVATDARKPCSI
jgi:hypothetical protein